MALSHPLGLIDIKNQCFSNNKNGKINHSVLMQCMLKDLNSNKLARFKSEELFKGRISELLSQLRFMHNTNAASGGGAAEKYTVESFVQCDIQNLLKQQQDGIAALVKMSKQDLSDLQRIAE